MKSLPKWTLVGISIAILGGVIGMVSQFAEKSFIYAQGEVFLPPELEEKATGIRTLFIVLYDTANPAPMPYGAIRMNLAGDAKGSFHKFVITKDNLQVMRPSHRIPKTLRIKARLDRSGTAGMDAPGDIVGEILPVKTGSTDVRITINKLIDS
ncbi:MAG: hypothetical protein AB8G05_08735 [Oligoflexales bacterium]